MALADPTGRLPARRATAVLVWVHGSSYVIGAGDLPLYDPAALVGEQRGRVVAVTYRLGLLGFLRTEGGTPNLGPLDLLLALRRAPAGPIGDVLARERDVGASPAGLG